MYLIRETKATKVQDSEHEAGKSNPWMSFGSDAFWPQHTKGKYSKDMKVQKDMRRDPCAFAVHQEEIK